MTEPILEQARQPESCEDSPSQYLRPGPTTGLSQLPSQEALVNSKRLDDPYLRAWLKWLERDKMEKQVRKERLEKQEE